MDERDEELARIAEALEDESLSDEDRAALKATEALLLAEPAAAAELEPLAPTPTVVVTDVDVELADDYRPTGTDLVVVDEGSGQEVFAVLDRHDEDAVLAELSSRAHKRLFYDFDGKVDLSIHGVLECIGLMNRTGKARIAVDPSSASMTREVIADAEYIVARVYARDAISGSGVFGVAKQPVYMQLRNGSEQFDVFAETKALNKAQRNALGMLIPQKIRAALVAQARGDVALVREIQHGVGARAVAELPPPLDDEKARALIARCRELYDEIRGVNFKAMMPGRFGIGLQRATHSHDLLETFVGELEAILEHEKGAVA